MLPLIGFSFMLILMSWPRGDLVFPFFPFIVLGNPPSPHTLFSFSFLMNPILCFLASVNKIALLLIWIKKRVRCISVQICLSWILSFFYCIVCLNLELLIQVHLLVLLVHFNSWIRNLDCFSLLRPSYSIHFLTTPLPTHTVNPSSITLGSLIDWP